MTEHTWSDSRVQIGQSGGLDCISETRRHGVVKERANGVRCATKRCVSYRTGRYKREGKILEREGVAGKIVGASDGAVGHIGHREGVVCGTRGKDARIHGEASKHRCCDELRQEGCTFRMHAFTYMWEWSTGLPRSFQCQQLSCWRDRVGTDSRSSMQRVMSFTETTIAHGNSIRRFLDCKQYSSGKSRLEK